MDLDLIEYLESKNFEVEEIIRFQKNLRGKKDENIIKKMESIYKVFGYAGLPDLTINSLIVNNPGLLYRTDTEIIKIAFSWLDTGILDDAATRKQGINCENCTRTYSRNLYLNSGINFLKSPISYNAFKMGDTEFREDYIGVFNDKMFNPSFENLIIIYGKGKTIDEKKQYIEKMLSNMSLKWYMGELRKEKEKKDNGISI